MTSTTTPVKCPCGAIQLELAGSPIAQFYCHCDDCQIVHGAAYVPIAVYPIPSAPVTRGEPKTWALKTTDRASCPACGTRVFADIAPLGIRCVSASLLPAGTFRPEFHMQCRFATVPLNDDLPHFEGLPPQLGGSDARVPW